MKPSLLTLRVSATSLIYLVLLTSCQEGLRSNEARKSPEEVGGIPPANESAMTNLPRIVATFVGDPRKGGFLRVEVTSIQRECLLAVAIVPDRNLNTSKPIPPRNAREIGGLPMVSRVEPPGGTLDIHYPDFVFDGETNLSGGQRAITGWEVTACLTDHVTAWPVQGARKMGDIQNIGPADLPSGLCLLASIPDAEAFSECTSFAVKSIPNSNAGAFFYVDEDVLIAWKQIVFDADFNRVNE